MGVRYDPVGQCIYCGTKEDPLRREHIIPYGLGGDLLLPSASCDECCKKTGAIEGFCLRRMFGDLRNAAGMQTRRPKERPTSLIAKFRRYDDTVEEVPVSPAEYPQFVTLFELPPARILRGLPDTGEPVSGANLWTWASVRPTRDIRRRRGLTKTVIEGYIDPSKFSQMVAKIGHCYAVATLGVDRFTPLAIDLAVGRTDHMNYLVGSQVTFDNDPIPDDGLHSLRLYTHESGMILALVRLFAQLGAPTFHVAVGLKKGGEIVPFVQRLANG